MLAGMSEAKFRFLSKGDYERELERLISSRNSAKKKSTLASLDEEYDLLMEEYLSFCSVERDG